MTGVATRGAASAGAARNGVGAGPGPGLELDGVTVAYGSSPPVVRDVSLTLDPGSWLSLIGPNGAGKSSLLKAIAGLVDHGGVVTRTPRTAHTNGRGHPGTAYVAQRPLLPPGMTVAEYVLLGRSAHLGWLAVEGADDRAVVDEVLDRLSLGPFADRRVTELSGGEVQRVVLARALAQQAPLLLLDEPTSALDIGHSVEVLELVDGLRRSDGLTVVAAMHDLGAAGRFADRLALLHEGGLVAEGPPQEVLTEPILSRYYRTPVQVIDGVDGSLIVAPRHGQAGRTERSTEIR